MEAGGRCSMSSRRHHCYQYVSRRLSFTSSLFLSLLLLLLLTTITTQATGVTGESSNVSVRGGCGATPNSHGVCGPDGKLRCRAGWAGERCDRAVCKKGCSPQHGMCHKPGDCHCGQGWRGPLCDECIPLPGCQQGFCNTTSFQCHCEDGWTGPHCSKATCRDGCHMTRGYCDSPGECKCRIGWGGPTCDKCAVVPGCQNGFCQKPLECRCHPGWSGHLCQNPICTDGCHEERGSCNKPGECRCSLGYLGPTCSQCHPYPGCKNGYCNKPWECICEAGWTGMTCDKRIERIPGYCDTNANACLNGGTCIDVLGPRNYTCSCPSLFTGKRCDYLAERRPRPSFFQGTTTTKRPTTITLSTTSKPTTTASPSTTTATTTQAPTIRTILYRKPSQRTTTIATTAARRVAYNSYLSSSVDDEDDPVIEDYDETPRGQHSRIHAVTASPRKLKQQKRQRELDAKNARRLFLQKQATITFRQPKIVPTIRTRSRPLKLPFTVIDRKHLSLPVFLPRVSEVVRKNKTKSKSAEILESNRTVSIQLNNLRTNTTGEDSTESSTEQIKTPTESNMAKYGIGNSKVPIENGTDKTSKDNTPIPIKSVVLGNLFQDSSVTTKETDRIIDSHVAWKQEEYRERIRGEQTIKDLLEEYDKPKPVLVTDYNDPENKNFNEIPKSNNNQIDESLIFINEKRRFLQPESLNLASENSQESTANGPSRPMFLVAVRPLPHPDGTLRPIPVRSGNPIISFSHGNYPSATFLQESRTGKFLPQARSAGSVRGPIQFASPSFSVSHPHTFNIRHFAPQTRLSRRIGHASSVPYTQSYSREMKLIPEEDSMTSASETKQIHFYEEHLAGSVHIGVDRHTPPEEIKTAFIEIKKSHI